MKTTIDGSIYYIIPNTSYCISADRMVYSIKTQSFVATEGTTVRLTIAGERGRYNCDKLLIDALLAHIDEIKHFINSSL